MLISFLSINYFHIDHKKKIVSFAFGVN